MSILPANWPYFYLGGAAFQRGRYWGLFEIIDKLYFCNYKLLFVKLFQRSCSCSYLGASLIAVSILLLHASLTLILLHRSGFNLSFEILSS